MAGSLLPEPKQQFLNDIGAPLFAGQIFTYSAGTLTPKSTYQDQALTIENTNPVVANARGEVVMYGSGSYRLILKDFFGNTIYDRDNIETPNVLSDAFSSSLSASSGSSLVGFIQNGYGAFPTTVQEKLRESVSITDFYANGVSGAKVDPTGIIDSTAGIQAALNRKGRIYIPSGKYRISSTLTIYGGTMFYGAGMGVSIFDWHGPTTGNIMQDSSLINPLDVNLNIVLADFEIAGNSYSDNPLYAIRMYRVGRAKYIGLLLHDVGGSLLLWGVSQADTVDIEISGCIFERAFNGDSCQGIGERVVVRDCYAFSAGDTCYALLYDTSPITNPTYLFTSNVVFDNCVAVGEYDQFGIFQGAGRPTQLGFSFGPFNIAVNINVSITNCLCEGLYQNVWMVVFGKLKLNDNTFKQHSNTTTAGVRLDGIMNATIDGNSFEAGLVGTGGNYGSLLINAQRNIYGSSIFDASNKFTVISSNTFEHDTAPAIVLAADPTYPIQISDIVISDNTFAGVTLPVQFRPLISTGLAFKNINISGNTVDSAATAFLTCFGSPPQYSNVSMADNSIGSVPPLAGSSDNILVSGSNSLVTPNVLAATATTVFTLPSTGFNTIQVQSWVQIANNTYSSIATFILTAGVARLAWKSDGANFSTTLSGNSVQVTQAGIGTQTVYSTVKYIS